MQTLCLTSAGRQSTPASRQPCEQRLLDLYHSLLDRNLDLGVTMNLVTMLNTKIATDRPKRKTKVETVDTSKTAHILLVQKVREATGKSFTSKDIRHLVTLDSSAARICRRLLKAGYVKVEKGAVAGLAFKKLNKYTWKDHV